MVSIRAIALVVLTLFSVFTQAQQGDLLSNFIAQTPAAQLFPGADRYGPVEGSPPTAPVYSAGEPAGYVFLNSAVVNAVGYSGKPIHIVVALDTNGVIRAARLLEHHEPIVLVGIPEAKITALINGYIGFDVLQHLKTRDKSQRFDAISGATVTVRVIDDSIVRSAVKVARAYGLGGISKPVQRRQAHISQAPPRVKSWDNLLAENTIGHLSLSGSRVDEVFEGRDTTAAEETSPQAAQEVPFVDLYAAQVSVPTIGLSLLGKSEYKNLQHELAEGQHAILLAGRGEYSYKGSGYVRGGIFDRFEIVQGDDAIRFRDLHHKRLRRIAAPGAPDFKEVDLFKIPADAKFDPVRPWRLQLIVSRETDARKRSFFTFNLDYRVPDEYLITEQPPAAVNEVTAPDSGGMVPDTPGMAETPLWQKLWRDKVGEIVLLLIVLTLVTAIFFFQDWLVRRPRLSRGIRLGVLLYTLLVLGFYSSGQLSVVNILTVFNALVSGFSWEYFLMEPLTFILWGSVITGLLFWGRGAYCGWMCPFGALQELLNKIAKRFRIPQYRIPWAVHERLWPIKYLIFLVLFGVSLHSLSLAERLAEVEPFKTAIILNFIREWPFVVFAVATLAVGLFIERFYCRYLCPLGAALAIPGRLRMFEWLKRYRQCGNPCELCAKGCMVQAIHPEGHINPNECLYCLHCQELYYDDHRCPVMVAKRKRREGQELLASTHTAALGQQILAELRERKKGGNHNTD